MKLRQGFALIELLVVIAIIAILAAILFPVFAQAREKARQTTCLSNGKQIGLATIMYVNDYDEMFPFQQWRDWGDAQVPGRRRVWTMDIAPYVKAGQYCTSGHARRAVWAVSLFVRLTPTRSRSSTTASTNRSSAGAGGARPVRFNPVMTRLPRWLRLTALQRLRWCWRKGVPTFRMFNPTVLLTRGRSSCRWDMCGRGKTLRQVGPTVLRIATRQASRTRILTVTGRLALGMVHGRTRR